MSRTFYVRCEAVNLGESVYDTEDLSTIRGSGLAILNVATPLCEACRKLDASDLKVVTSGASQAVVQVTLSGEGKTLEDFRTDVEQELRRDKQLRFATVVVAVSSAGYDIAREELVAAIRFRQMGSMRLSAAGITATDDFRSTSPEVARPWCAIDMVRPAEIKPKNLRKPEKKRLSRSMRGVTMGSRRSKSSTVTLRAFTGTPSVTAGTSSSSHEISIKSRRSTNRHARRLPAGRYRRISTARWP